MGFNSAFKGLRVRTHNIFCSILKTKTMNLPQTAFILCALIMRVEGIIVYAVKSIHCCRRHIKKW